MEKDVGILQIGDRAPDFRAQSTSGDIRFYDWLGNGWALMLAYPDMMTAECVEEFRAIEELHADFAAIGCKIIGCITDCDGDFEAWAGRISKCLGRLPRFPVVHMADSDSARLPAPVGCSKDASRKLIVVAPDRRVKLMVAYSMVTASMFGEILRLIESLQDAGERRSAKPGRGGDNLVVLPDATENIDVDRAGLPECGPYNGQRKELQRRNHC
jgi:alkyl hydroperoxide reductase subunit AhpC